MSQPLRFSSYLGLALLLLMTLLCCLPAVDAPFTYDEHAGIEDNRVVHPGAKFSEALAFRYSPDQARPLFFASLLLDADLWGMQPRGFRVVGFILHLACGVLLYLLLKRPPLTQAGALAGSALFLLHPLQSESVLYIWGRSEILSTLFGLAAVLLMLPSRLGLSHRAGALACMVLALASKEEAIAIPIIFYVWWTLVEGRPQRPGLGRAAVLAAPVLAFVLLRALVLGGIGRQVYVRSVMDNILGQGVVTLRMISLTLVPFGQSVDHDVRVPGTGLGILMVVACLLLAAATTLALRSGIPRARVFGAGVLIAAVSSILYWLVPLPDLMCERRSYLPLAGAAVSLAGLMIGVRRRPYLVTAVLVILLAPLLALRAHVWADPIRLWGEAARLAPEKARPLINLGVVAAEKGDRDKASELFGSAIALEPQNAEALFNRGKVYLDAGEPAKAIHDLEAAVAANPGLVRARINLAIARIDVRDLEGAESELRVALEIEPGNPRALTNLGEVLRATKRERDAVELYRQALDADPTYAHAAARLGVTLEKLGDREGALSAYREFLARATPSATDRRAVEEKIKALQAP